MILDFRFQIADLFSINPQSKIKNPQLRDNAKTEYQTFIGHQRPYARRH
jgi:hypothetical protein